MLGFFAGTAWITGYTLLGLEVEDAFRGRTFAFVQTLIRLTLALVLARGSADRRPDRPAPLAGDRRLGARLQRCGDHDVRLGCSSWSAVGLVAYHQMNDRPGVSIGSELRQSLMRDNGVYADRGVFVALEGGEGAGKSTQARLLRESAAGAGYDVVLTHEPGDSDMGRRLREILLSPSTGATRPPCRGAALRRRQGRARREARQAGARLAVRS